MKNQFQQFLNWYNNQKQIQLSLEQLAMIQIFFGANEHFGNKKYDFAEFAIEQFEKLNNYDLVIPELRNYVLEFVDDEGYGK